MNDIPDDFLAALKKGRVEAAFAKYPPSHRREHLKHIREAKRPDTRKSRIEKAVKMIAEKAKG